MTLRRADFQISQVANSFIHSKGEEEACVCAPWSDVEARCAVEVEPGSCAVGLETVTGGREVLFKAPSTTKCPTTHFLLGRREACGVCWSWDENPCREERICLQSSPHSEGHRGRPTSGAPWPLLPCLGHGVF